VKSFRITMRRKSATPVKASVRKTPVTINPNIAKALSPKDPESLRIGGEPEFNEQPLENVRFSTLATSLHWYNRFYGRKDAKDLMIQYLVHNGKTAEAKIMGKVGDEEFSIPTFGWLARLTMRGLILTEKEQKKLDTEVARLLAPIVKVESNITGKKKVKSEVSVRPNVQEIMREKARDAGGELEGVMDDFNLSGAKASTTADAVSFLTRYNVLPQHTSIITDAWKRKLAEYEEVLEGKDPQLVQAYSHLTKTQVKNTIKFIESMLASINSYISNKKVSKAPRRRKAVPPEKVVAKLKYLKEFKDEKLKLNLVSVHPKTLLTASEAWVYDTAKRRMHHFMADDLAKTFSVKGNTLLGFDTLKSEVKTLRKPTEQIKEIVGSKPAARKFFKDIKAVASSPNGRFNADMVILKAW
jgi:hypothetical protein